MCQQHSYVEVPTDRLMETMQIKLSKDGRIFAAKLLTTDISHSLKNFAQDFNILDESFAPSIIRSKKKKDDPQAASFCTKNLVAKHKMKDFAGNGL